MSLFCVVLVHPLLEPFPVDISDQNTINDFIIHKDQLTIGHLKSLIIKRMTKENPAYGNTVKTLWKVEELVEDSKKWKELEEIVKEINDEQKLEHKLQKE